MEHNRSIQYVLIVGTLLFFTGVLLAFKRDPLKRLDPYSAGLFAQNYRGPIHPIPGNPQLVRVEVLVRDSPALGGVQVSSATFNGQAVLLKPRDIYGNRGSTSFQVPPGKYRLVWTVQRDKVAWPRTLTHEETVTIDPRDLWIQVSIEGEQVSIR